MTSIFIKLFNMSITASYVVGIVIVLRLILKKVPKSIHCFLWALVAVRLVFPFSVESVFSLIPSIEAIAPGIIYSEAPKINTGISLVNNMVNPVISQRMTPAPEAALTPMEVLISAASILWVIGMVLMIVYSAVSYLRLKRKVAAALPMEDNIFRCDEIPSPFILGMFRPAIYIPGDIDENNLRYVIAHERTHLRRKDQLIKPLGFLILTVYWFNPLIWIAYTLLCRDIELACDENVIKEMGSHEKKSYSTALLECSIDRKTIAACLLAFGEVGVKGRVKNILNYRRPPFWVLIGAIIASIAVALCFLTNPKTSSVPKVALTFGVYEIKDIEHLGAWFSSTWEYFLNNAKGRKYIIDKDYFSIDSRETQGDIYHEDIYYEAPQYVKEEINKSIVLMDGEEPITLDISNYKSATSYQVLDSSGEDTNYRIFILDDNVWIGHYNWFGTNHDAWLCEYIFSLERLGEVTSVGGYDSPEVHPITKVTSGYLARNYTETITEEKILAELFNLYRTFTFGDKAIKIKDGDDLYTVTFEFTSGEEATIIFLDKDRYGLFLPESNSLEYLPVLNGNTDIYNIFYELHSINR